MTGARVDAGAQWPATDEQNHRSVPTPHDALQLLLDGGGTLIRERQVDHDGLSATVRLGGHNYHLALEVAES